MKRFWICAASAFLGVALIAANSTAYPPPRQGHSRNGHSRQGHSRQVYPRHVIPNHRHTKYVQPRHGHHKRPPQHVMSKGLKHHHRHVFSRHGFHSHFRCRIFWHPYYQCWFYWHPVCQCYLPVTYIYEYPPMEDDSSNESIVEDPGE